jgi:hypothetical protein
MSRFTAAGRADGHCRSRRALPEHHVPAAAELAQGTLVAVPLTDQRLASTRVTLVKGLAAYTAPATSIVSDALLTAMGD